jgi:serine protease Do
MMLALVGTVDAKPTAGQKAGWLGVALQDVTEDVRDALPRNVREGAMISEVVEDSPADNAGLEEGDVITRFDGESIGGASDLTKAVRDASPDETVDIEFYRDGRLMRERVTLAEREDETPDADVTRPRTRRFEWRGEEPNAPRPPRTPHMFQFQELHGTYLGVHLMDLNDQLAEYFGTDKDGGALVTEVMEDSPAAEAGVKAGDVITQIGDEEVSDVAEVRDALQDYEEGESVEVHVLRKGQALTLTAKVDKRDGMQQLRRSMMFDTPMPGELQLGWEGALAPPVPPERAMQRQEFRKQMDELRKELDQLREELSDLKSKRP